MNQNIRQRIDDLSLGTRISLLALLFILISTTVIAYFLDRHEQAMQLSDRAAREGFRLQLNGDRLQKRISDLQRDVLFLSQTPPVQGIIRAMKNRGYDAKDESSLGGWKRRLQKIFEQFGKARPSYYQFRFIGLRDDGKELVRVDIKDGKALVTSPDRLQKKAGRGYFKQTEKLKSGEVYLSEINLNREWGKIEVPHVRTLRGGTPVYTSEGTLFGMIVVNLDLGNMLDKVITDSHADVKTYLINSNGDFLIHPVASHTFGFDLGKRYLWQGEFPEINLNDVTHEQGMDALKSYKLPNGKVYVSAKRIDYDIREPNRYLTLVYVVPQSVLEKQIAASRNLLIASVSGVALLVILSIGYVLRRSFLPLQKLTEIAHAIGDGNYKVKLPESSHGEIGTFVRAFREMLSGIREREEHNEVLSNRLIESERQANSIIDTAPESIVVVNGKGEITRVNSFGLELFGYKKEELIGKPVEVLIPDKFRYAHQKEVGSYLINPAQRNMGIGKNLYALCKNGDEIPVEVGLGPMCVDDDKYVIAILTDITQRKQAEEALHKLNSELEQRIEERTQQLVASNQELEQFAYVASHDLQEPLRMVSSYLQLIEKRYKSQLDETASEFIEFAVDGANRMKQLIEGLLEYSRVQTRAKEFGPVDLEVVLHTVLTDLQIRIEERGATITHDSMPKITGDESQIRRLIQNLIGNSMKYCTNDTPVIHLAAEELASTSQELPEGTARSDGWIISVSDNGIGIDPQYSDRIFQLFQRLHTRKEYPGTGLGLAVCKRIVERHGGKIWVKSQAGKGSTFYFILERIPGEVVLDDKQMIESKVAGGFSS